MDLEKLWTDLLGQLKSYPNVNASQVDAFFSRVQVQAAAGNFVMLTSDNSFIKNWIETHYLKDIKQSLRDLYGTDFDVQIEVDPSAAPQQTEATIASTATARTTPTISSPVVVEIPKTTTPVQNELKEESQLTPEQNSNTASTLGGLNALTFDTFVIGDSNRMAYNMAVEVADHPGSTALNPLFIYGRSGVGKTHLLCAIKNYINEQYPDFDVCYIDSMELVNKYSDAAIEKNFKGFESFFQDKDILLIDDVQSLQNKTGTLDMLFRLFNSQIAKGKQFVFSADRAPKNIDIDERYTTRFNSGATIDIQPPDDETKRNIIRGFIKQYKKEEGGSFEISDEVLDYIVENSSSNIRELKSAITNVIFTLKFNQGHEIKEEEIAQLLENHFLGGGKKRITIEIVQKSVEEFYSVSHKELIGKKRERRIVRPRQVAIYLCHELSESTLKTIGEAFNRDHTTVMHSCNLIDGQTQEDRNLREELEAIRGMIRNQQY